MTKRSNPASNESEPDPKRAPLSALDQLRTHSVVVADTGDFRAIEKFKPDDSTTNPSLLYQACQLEKYAELVESVIGGYVDKSNSEMKTEVVDEICDRLAVAFGCEILKIIPGMVSTEVDASLSFDTDKSVKKARKLIDMYEKAGIKKERILIKMATTWEGCEAAKVLQAEGIKCNMTLVFCLIQAAAASEAGATLISPFVGRILDWHIANVEQKSFSGDADPGVQSVRKIFHYLKSQKSRTVVMGASFRNIDEPLALAGCDKLTIAPNLLEQLENSQSDVPLKLNKEVPEATDSKITISEASFRWALNEDAMATEKLSQGIRSFNADHLKLKELVSKRAGY